MRGRRAALAGLAVFVLAAGLSLGAAVGDDALDDLLTAFQLTPLGDQKPTPFTLDSIDGKSISLADVRGRAVLLYFWESG
jgi:cytochrome oxidase Cu insertion factor (SCO1/SenC/PrrC family)